MNPWLRFLTIFAAAAVGFTSAGMAVNYFVDVGHVYRADSHDNETFIKTFVERLRTTSNGVPLPPFEREVKIELVEESHADCFVTGSSHEMKVNLHDIAELRTRCRGLVNLAVSGGSYEDFVTMAAQVAKQPGTRAIYVGLSPWFFRFDADSRYKSYEGEYAAARRLFGLEDHGVRTGSSAKLLNLINGQYLGRNVDEIVKTIEVRGFGMDDPSEHDKESQLLQLDGSVRESEEQRRYLSARKIPDVSPTQKNIGNYKFEGQRTDGLLLRDFKTIVATLQKEKIAVNFVLSPYHPSVFACTNPAICQWLDQMEQQVCGLAGELHIRTIGSYRPDRFGLTWRDFTDDHHVTRSAVPRYWHDGCGAPAPKQAASQASLQAKGQVAKGQPKSQTSKSPAPKSAGTKSLASGDPTTKR